MLGLLKTEIRSVVDSYCTETVFREAMLRVLTSPGFALNPNANCRAGALALEVHLAACGRLDAVAYQAAAAVELQMEAAFLFDDVADREVDERDGFSEAEVLSLAIALLSCGSAAACQAAHRAGRVGISAEPVLQFHSNYIGACGGQFLDAYFERRDSATIDDALEMTSLKAGKLGNFATAFGASIATDDPKVISLFGEFGLNVFTYLQIIDDLRDACPAEGARRDLEQRKKTVPLVYFYDYLGAEGPGHHGDIMLPDMLSRTGLDVEAEFEGSGAVPFSAIVAETYLNRAKHNLADLNSHVKTVSRLEQLLETISISPRDLSAFR